MAAAILLSGVGFVKVNSKEPSIEFQFRRLPMSCKLQTRSEAPASIAQPRARLTGKWPSALLRNECHASRDSRERKSNYEP
jgi:hypothetical protein